MAANDLIGTRLAVTLHELVHLIDGFADQLVRDRFGVSYSQYHFLAVTSTLERPDVTTLAECLMVSKAAVSKRLAGLVAEELITIGNDPAHARRVIVELTPKATALVTAATELLEREFHGALDELPAGEVDELNDRLRGLLQVFAHKRDASAASAD